MVRIKFTAPVQAVQLQSKSTPRRLVSNDPVSVQKKANQEVIEEASQFAVQESLALKQQQSLEMVQIMLHVSFGTLFYLREFLPLACFDDRDLKKAQREHKFSYQEFINGKAHSEYTQSNPERTFGQGKRAQPLKILIRNSDPKADTILDLLEHGIFDALKKHVLEAVQLTVLIDKETPTNVLESYTFTFKYTGGAGDMNSRLESLSLDPVGCVADMKTVQTARMGLEMIVRRLITLSAFLPALPNKRNLGIHLFYTEDCPSDYEPPGFAMATDDTVKYPFDENWRKECQSCGTMDSGYHTVGLKVTSLKWTGPEPDNSEIQPEIPMQIEYNDTVPRTADIGLPQEEHVYHDLRSEQSSPQETNQTTQTRQDITARQKLQKMVPAASPSQDSDLIPTQPFNMNAITGNNGIGSQRIVQRTLLSQPKAAEIRQYLHSQKPDFLGSSDGSNNGLVRCQCGWEGEESAMIECTFCHTRQHLLCYGFRDLDDPRVPDTHACYQCLLEPGETNLLREMNTLVLLRRALGIILSEGYPNTVSAFTQKLHCNGHTVVQITDLLRKQGFLHPTPGYKSKGFLRKGLPKFSIPHDEDIKQKMEREILDPMAKIRHHYNQETIEGRVGESSSDTTQEVKFIDKMDVGGKETSSTGRDIDDQETLGSDDELVDLGSSNPNSKRKALWDESGNENHDSSNQSVLSKENVIASFGDHQNSQHSISNEKISAAPIEQVEIRRSPRKRRKISNYARLIDVGMATSDEEGI